MKKVLLIISIIVLIAGVDNVYAESNLSVVVDNSSFSISKEEATIGEKITIKVSLSTNTSSPLKNVNVYFTKPVTKKTSDAYTLIYNQEQDLYETTLTIDDTWQNGKYIIDRMYFYDGNSSYSLYNSKNPNALGYGYSYDWSVDLSKCTFIIYGSSADDSPPKINGASLTLSSRQLITDDIMKYTIKITDNVGIKEAKLRIYNNSYNVNEDIILSYNSFSDLYEGYVTVDSNMKKGTWGIYYFYVKDVNDNYEYVYNSAFTTTSNVSKYNWSNSIYSFYNYGIAPDSQLDSDSLNVDVSRVTSGEKVNISLQLMNYFGIDNIFIYYKNIDNNKVHIVEAKFEKTKYTGSTSGIKYYYNIYKAVIEFNNYGYNGKWTIDKIVVNSLKDNVTTIYNSELNNIATSVNLSSGDFETYGLTTDNTPPNIYEFLLDKTYAYCDEDINLRVSANDDLSGVQTIIVNYLLPNGVSKDYLLSDNDNSSFKLKITCDNLKKIGLYILNYIELVDKAGNNIRIYKELEKMNFNFNNKINIVSPSYYLNLTTSYTLKALEAFDVEINNVVWKSTDPSIASINSKTGVLSTKSKEGEVTVIVSDSEDDGVYGYIKLFVASTIVKVGETKNIGNFNYVTYKDVLWEIENESILNKTGTFGYNAINSYYKHYINVKGLKEGTTRIKMLTPSGDVLATSIVYVDNSIVNISNTDKIISISKNKTFKLNPTINYIDNSSKSDSLYYIIENKKIASISPNGEIKALSSGETTIKVYSQYFDNPLIIPISVYSLAESINVETNPMILNIGDKHKIVYNVYPEDAINNEILFKSNNENIINVDSDGLVTAVGNGYTTIMVTTKDNSINKIIKVNVGSVFGDMNNNKKIDLKDIIILIKKYLGTDEATDTDILIGDMNNNGRIDLKDIIILIRTYLGLE